MKPKMYIGLKRHVPSQAKCGFRVTVVALHMKLLCTMPSSIELNRRHEDDSMYMQFRNPESKFGSHRPQTETYQKARALESSAA